MRPRPCLAALAGAFLAFAGGAEAGPRKAPRPPSCPGGRFANAAPLLPDALPGLPDAIEFAGGKAFVASGCAPIDAELRGSRRGDKLKVTWPSCRGLAKKVKLSARIDAGCRFLTGSIRSKGWRTKFEASLEPVRACDYVPGVSVPAVMPPEVVSPPPDPPPDPLPPLPDPTAVPQATTELQLAVFDALWQDVFDDYVDPDFGGVDWLALRATYRARIEQGLADDDFYGLMDRALLELADDHSHYQDPGEVEERAAAEGMRFVGMGAVVERRPDEATGSLVAVFPHSPAAALGLRPHDLVVEVDGLPFFDPEGVGGSRGEEGTSFTLTYQRPGEAPRSAVVVRRAVTDFIPVDACVVPGTGIGYVNVTTVSDPLIDERVHQALFRMTREGPLEGLVLDQRMNGGGASDVALPLLALFQSGLQGTLVSRDERTEYTVAAVDVGGSQFVPLVVLADTETVSYGEITTGALQASGRATVVGGPTAGNVELLTRHDYADGSRAWIAHYTFEPVGLPAGVWEGVGILPDDEVRTRWDLFTEETDPALARAVELLQTGFVPVPAATRRAAPDAAPRTLPETRSGAAADLGPRWDGAPR
jgi:C-terminal peptidase prc